MVIFKWVVGILIAVMLGLFLHYTLPSRDIVQIVGTDVKRMDIGNSIFWASPDAGTNKESTRDVRFINVAFPDGKPFVYRNEDTDWSWPPYFKFDSGTITAQAQSLAKQDEVWVAVRHYGWRIKLFTIFPNAVSIKQVSGPDAFLFPWFNTVFFLILGAILYGFYRVMATIKERQVDPVLESLEETADNVSRYAEETHSAAQEKAQNVEKGLKGWFKRWFGETKK